MPKRTFLHRPGPGDIKSIDNNIYIQIQANSNKKHYTHHISISFNQQNSLAVRLASQSIQAGKKEPREQTRQKKIILAAGEKEKKGKQKGIVVKNTNTLLSSPSHSSPPPRHARA